MSLSTKVELKRTNTDVNPILPSAIDVLQVEEFDESPRARDIPQKLVAAKFDPHISRFENCSIRVDAATRSSHSRPTDIGVVFYGQSFISPEFHATIAKINSNSALFKIGN